MSRVLRTASLELGDATLLCVVGPTASQKTELAIRVCEEIGGEVIGADSVQIYRAFDIGSGKPTREERARARHHVVDVADPHAPWDAARWALAADEAIAQVRARGKVPVVCGGTFLWVRALVLGLAEAPAADPLLRAQLDDEARRSGVAALHARLVEADPVTAARLNPNDYVRVQRALEVFALTGRRLSDLHAEHRAKPPRHDASYVGVRWEAAMLEERIRRRAEQWLRTGWIEEVEALLDLGLRDTRPMASVGYRQIASYLEGKTPREDLLDEVSRATKVFARRQRTWLRDAPVRWVDPF
jgi:tRNA dimethylallyltransferase